jgi:4-hydroxy-4-methyl-2-oxoglutarate aldolase
MSGLSENEIIRRLEKIDTPTISNVVAAYPESDLCLKLYDAWSGQWYTDSTMRCMYPELGPRLGYVATAIFSEKSDQYRGVHRWALPEHLDGTKKPVILVAKQAFQPFLANRVGLFGGNLTAQYKALGCVGVVTDGPIRDIDEIRAMAFQYLATGVTPSHGAMVQTAVGVPVTVCGMTVVPGEVVHMDAHGAVKFPASRMTQVLENAQRLLKREAERRKVFEDRTFSLAKWKKNIEAARSPVSGP